LTKLQLFISIKLIALNNFNERNSKIAKEYMF